MHEVIIWQRVQRSGFETFLLLQHSHRLKYVSMLSIHSREQLLGNHLFRKFCAEADFHLIIGFGEAGLSNGYAEFAFDLPLALEGHFIHFGVREDSRNLLQQYIHLRLEAADVIEVALELHFEVILLAFVHLNDLHLLLDGLFDQFAVEVVLGDDERFLIADFGVDFPDLGEGYIETA